VIDTREGAGWGEHDEFTLPQIDFKVPWREVALEFEYTNLKLKHDV
jgi:hypothetical protein